MSREQVIARLHELARDGVGPTMARWNEGDPPMSANGVCSALKTSWGRLQADAGLRPGTPRDAAQERRERALAAFQEQVKRGEVRVRYATEAERARWAREREQKVHRPRPSEADSDGPAGVAV